MPTPAFPTLTAKAKTCPQEFVDNAIKSSTESGYVLARPRFTRNMLKFGPIQMVVDGTDLGLFQAFYDQVGTYTIFTWTHPTTATSYNVRFASPPKIAPLPDTLPTGRIYSIEYAVDQV